MKYEILIIGATFVLSAYAANIEPGQSTNNGLEFENTDDESAFKEKIKKFSSTTLHRTLSAINEIHQNAENSFTSLSSDIAKYAMSFASNLDKQFRNNMKNFELHKNDPNTPRCLFSYYSYLTHILDASKTKITTCWEASIKDIQNIKIEVDSNIAGIKVNLEMSVESLKDCYTPWTPKESQACATEKVGQIQKILSDTYKTMKAAESDILERLKAIIETVTGCVTKIVEDTKLKGSKIQEKIKLCTKGSK